MPYGKKAGSVRAWEFGCLPPIEGEAPAVDAMFRRVRLWNSLVEVTRAHDERVEALLAPHLAEVNARKPEAAKGEAKNGKDARMEAWWKEYKAARKAAWKLEEVKGAAAELERELREAARPLWLGAGLYWCNYETVQEAWGNGRRRVCPYSPDCDRKGNDPECKMIVLHRRCCELRFHSARMEPGKVTVRWQTGLPVAELFGGDTRATCARVSEEAWESPVRAVRRKAARTTLRLRVASEGRRPVWLVLPMVMHRPLPADGLVRTCSVLRERVGLSWRWKAVFVVATPERAPEPLGAGRVSLDLGWRKRPHGLRVCAWRDEAGHEGELCLPLGWLSEMSKVEDLRGIRDDHLNRTRAVLVAWLAETPAAPEWIAEERRRCKTWRSQSSMMRLVRLWRDARFPGDDVAVAMLEEWRKREVHLFEWEANLRDQLIRHRRELYRRFAAGLARRYGSVVLEEFDLRPVAERGEKAKAKRREMDTEHRRIDDAARHQRVWAATSVLRLAVVNACEREGVLVERVPSAYTTVTCGECGSLERWDKARDLRHRCEACGVEWDQDLNAAKNLLTGQVAAVFANLPMNGAAKAALGSIEIGQAVGMSDSEAG